MKENNKILDKAYKWNAINVILIAIYAFLVASMLYLYYCFIYHSDQYPSDIPDHINGALNSSSGGGVFFKQLRDQSPC